jgi:hypothetical protein
VITGKLRRQLALRRNRTGKHAQYPRDGSLGDPARRPVAAFEGMDAATTAENDAQNSRFGTAGEAFQLPAKSHLTSWMRAERLNGRLQAVTGVRTCQQWSVCAYRVCVAGKVPGCRIVKRSGVISAMATGFQPLPFQCRMKPSSPAVADAG